MPIGTRAVPHVPVKMGIAMASAATNPKQQAHALIDRLAPGQVNAVVVLLETMLDPVSRAIANAPIDDEPESEAERQAVAQSKAWMQQHQDEAIPQEDLLREFGITPEDLKR